MLNVAIRRLPPDLINQIAAGEVVERPGSVVKELCENAIDAGATRIDVEIEGTEFLRVVDNGCGMTAADMHLALERHATSKISCAEDLWRLNTLGFRGEALPSIAAVSKLTMVSCPASAEAGRRLLLHAGELIEESTVGVAVGTQMEVRELFFNTPARRKFQRSPATELGHIQDCVLALALAHPMLHWRLTVRSRVALDLPPAADLANRARAALGRRGEDLFVAEGGSAKLHVHAAITPPEQSLPSARGLYLFVNRRSVRDRSLAVQAALGFGGLLPHGRYPAGVLHLTVDPADVDVNVHPQKAEVRFARPDEVHSMVRRVIAQAVTKAPWLGPVRSAEPLFVPQARESVIEYRPSLSPLLSLSPSPTFTFGTLRYIGQVLGTYLVCDTHDTLVLIDQHAAAERVAFERLRRSITAGRAPSQALLQPIQLEFDGREQAAVDESKALIESLGFDLTSLDGDRHFALRAVPAMLVQANPEQLVRDVLADLIETSSARTAEQKLEHIIATAACHAVVRAGDPLTPEEVSALLSALDGIDHHGSCPHGRPVLLRMPASEIERRFGRT